jgi:hypothetical protein
MQEPGRDGPLGPGERPGQEIRPHLRRHPRHERLKVIGIRLRVAPEDRLEVRVRVRVVIQPVTVDGDPGGDRAA